MTGSENGFMLRSIGVIHTPHPTREGAPIQPTGARGVRGQVMIDPDLRDGLDDLDGFSHIVLIYRLHLSRGYDLRVKPFLDTVKRGLFATRAPRRPNPIGISVVRLISIENNVLVVEDVDMVDGTPLLDIKPYMPDFDIPEGKTSTGWYERSKGDPQRMKADGRFL